MPIYLVDKKHAKLAFELAQKDDSAKIILIQDGIYVDSESISKKREVFYIGSDMADRGIEKFPESAKKISYDELIDLMENEKIYNFT